MQEILIFRSNAELTLICSRKRIRTSIISLRKKCPIELLKLQLEFLKVFIHILRNILYKNDLFNKRILINLYHNVRTIISIPRYTRFYVTVLENTLNSIAVRRSDHKEFIPEPLQAQE